MLDHGRVRYARAIQLSVTLHHILLNPDTYSKQYVRHSIQPASRALDNEPMLPQKPSSSAVSGGLIFLKKIPQPSTSHHKSNETKPSQ